MIDSGFVSTPLTHETFKQKASSSLLTLPSSFLDSLSFSLSHSTSHPPLDFLSFSLSYTLGLTLPPSLPPLNSFTLSLSHSISLPPLYSPLSFSRILLSLLISSPSCDGWIRLLFPCLLSAQWWDWALRPASFLSVCHPFLLHSPPPPHSHSWTPNPFNEGRRWRGKIEREQEMGENGRKWTEREREEKENKRGRDSRGVRDREIERGKKREVWKREESNKEVLYMRWGLLFKRQSVLYSRTQKKSSEIYLPSAITPLSNPFICLLSSTSTSLGFDSRGWLDLVNKPSLAPLPCLTPLFCKKKEHKAQTKDFRAERLDYSFHGIKPKEKKITFRHWIH